MKREDLEQREAKLLSPYATKSVNSKGRLHSIAPCALRTDFQRDRDRIIHSKSFRRLKYKTQVFLPARGDHFRTRLTHTLEVAQIARTMARNLNLNEDLTEAIALGHDLGHTPFGHAGERELNRLLRPEHTFCHNVQSLRTVDFLEKDGKGLNLTWEVRDGIVNHTGPQKPATPEGKLVRFADRIAYVNHDIDDALRSGILAPQDIPKDYEKFLGNTHSSRINAMVSDVVNESEKQGMIVMSELGWASLDQLRNFLFDHLYRLPKVKEGEDKGCRIIDELFHYYEEYPELIPSHYQEESLALNIADYIAGMTDQYAVQQFEKIFIPNGFRF